MKKFVKHFLFLGFGFFLSLLMSCGCYPYDEWGWGVGVVGYEEVYYEDAYDECYHPVRLEIALDWHSQHEGFELLDFDLLTPSYERISSRGDRSINLWNPEVGNYEIRVTNRSDFGKSAKVIIRILQDDRFSTLISETTHEIWIEPLGVSVVQYPLLYRSIYRCSY